MPMKHKSIRDLSYFLNWVGPYEYLILLQQTFLPGFVKEWYIRPPTSTVAVATVEIMH